MSARAGRPMPPRATALIVAYGILSVAGLLGTWYFNLSYRGSDGSYLEAWFANAASASAAVDLIVVAVVACVFYAVEGRRLGWRWRWLPFIPLTFVVALACALPLFLMVRELHLARVGSPEPSTRRKESRRAA